MFSSINDFVVYNKISIKLFDLLGPFSWPFVGNQFLLRRLSREFGGQHKAFLELSRRYCSDILTVGVGFEKLLIVSGHRLINMILKNEEFDGRPWNEFIKLRNMGKKQGIKIVQLFHTRSFHIHYFE